jgi:uncharacterized protein
VNRAQQSAFNADERAIQERAGGGPHGGGAIVPLLSEQHRNFFNQLPYVFVGVVDGEGWPIATLLTGSPGFVSSPDSATLHIAASTSPDDPAASSLKSGRDVGVLGIDLATRRRNRANGRIRSHDAAGFVIEVQQSFGNCPQYIQRRVLSPDSVPGSNFVAVERLYCLDDAARLLIGGADTFFVASRSRPGAGGAHGADISHRGGRPGFIRIDADVLTIPDFRGNHYFNTLGNISVEPRASLLFVDFERGDALHLQGRAHLDWDPAAAAHFGGAERLWHFHVERLWRRRGAVGLRWSFLDYSRTTSATGLWR